MVDFSSHGYGHAGMTIPVLNQLRRYRPDLKFTIRTTVPHAWIAERLEGDFDYRTQADFGMVMADTLHVRSNESAYAYWAYHSDWEGRVASAAEELASLSPSLLLSNIPYVSLAAAARIGVPSLALSSLNWADVFKQYCGRRPGAPSIWQQMADAYGAARIFLQVCPASEMPSIRNGRGVGPVATVGNDRRLELRKRLDIDDGQVVALLALGGIPTGFVYRRLAAARQH